MLIHFEFKTTSSFATNCPVVYCLELLDYLAILIKVTIVVPRKALKRYQRIVDKYNPVFSHVVQIKNFRLITSPCLPVHKDDSDAELTPTLKLKRRVIREQFASETSGIYTGPPHLIEPQT